MIWQLIVCLTLSKYNTFALEFQSVYAFYSLDFKLSDINWYAKKKMLKCPTQTSFCFHIGIHSPDDISSETLLVSVPIDVSAVWTLYTDSFCEDFLQSTKTYIIVKIYVNE